MFKHILLPTDGSRLSEASIKRGMQLAKLLEAKVTVLHVIAKFSVTADRMEMLESSNHAFAAESVERAQCYLDFARKVAKGAHVECEIVQVVSDQPSKAIIMTAQEKSCDLIQMASHGRRGIEGLLLGSETQKVLTHSNIPVLVYR
ncbi:MAG: universal stress protein [Rudaea sp.]